MAAYNLIAIIGPTACGKTRLAACLAASIDGEIISADSRQVYRSMNLGTGKDYGDYIINGKNVPYHLIDIVDAGYKYNVYEYQRNFNKAFDWVSHAGKTPILCGGTGLYVESVLKGYRMLSVPPNEELRHKLEGKTLDELTLILSTYKKLHNKTDVDTIKRAVRAIEIEEYYLAHAKQDEELPSLNPLLIGVLIDTETRRKRITQRLHERLQCGMLDEVQQLLNKGISPEDLIYYGLEYKYLTLHLTGELTYNEMVNKLEIAIHQFAKRQMTWFRGMERRGMKIHWIDFTLPVEEKIKIIKELLKN
jgi:tRNA dimethylallyltransferase